MTQNTAQPTTPVKQRILETTLLAVQDKKLRRRKNKLTAVCSVIFLCVIAVVYHQQTLPPEDTTASIPDNTPSTAPPESNIVVSIASNQGVKTLDISPDELARIVFNPNFKFTNTGSDFIWKSQTTLIQMHLPSTAMAITDSRY